MKLSITDPIGVDKPIQRVQDYLYANLNWGDLEAYGRIYKNTIDGKTKPQPFLSNNEYLGDAFIKDKNNACLFFIVNDKQEVVSGPVFKTEVKTVFMVNLKNVFPSLNHRADSEAQKHAYQLLKNKKAFQITGIETGLKTVLNGFDLEGLEKLDVQPFHMFAIVSTVEFKINPNC